MRRKLKNLKHKSGHSENGAPRQLIDDAHYREIANMRSIFNVTGTDSPHYASQFSGWSHARRPRDQSISIRAATPAIL